MGKIPRTKENLYPFPRGAFVSNQKYVYINTSDKYVPPSERKTDGTRGYTTHDRVCIGVQQIVDGVPTRFFYANDTYKALIQDPDEYPDPPVFSDSLCTGFHCFIKAASRQSGLMEDLICVFEEDTGQILDFCDFYLSRGSALLSRYPDWAEEHVLFSDQILDETQLGQFLKDTLTDLKIARFQEKWAVRNLDDAYLCFDSLRENASAEGVFLLEKDPEKNTHSLKQTDIAYALRQSDGLPLMYLNGFSDTSGVNEKQEKIKFIRQIKEMLGEEKKLCILLDRGFLSMEDIRMMDAKAFDYLLLLRSDCAFADKLADQMREELKRPENRIKGEEGEEVYAVSNPCALYPKGPTCVCHLIWSENKFLSKREEILREVSAKAKELEEFLEVSKNKFFTSKELDWIPPYFRLETFPYVSKEAEKKSERGSGSKQERPALFQVTGFTVDEEATKRLCQKAGISVFVTRQEMTAQMCLDAYSRKDCAAETFLSLKSHLGLDEMNVSPVVDARGKAFLWFVSSILYLLLSKSTETVKNLDLKNVPVSSVIQALEAIKAQKDPKTEKRKRRYKLTKLQKKILDTVSVDETAIDEEIAELMV